MKTNGSVFLFFLSVIIMFCFLSCKDCKRGEMWREKIYVQDDAYVYLYHTSDCRKEKPLMLNKEEMIYYMKKKYDVFDYCFNRNDLIMLSAISKRNIKDYIDNAPLFFEEDSEWEYYKKDKLILDNTPCKHSVNYAERDGTVVPLKREWFSCMQ